MPRQRVTRPPADGTPARWVLVALGNGDLSTHPLASGAEILLGRDLDCDVVLDHHRVSRRHARLRVPGTGDAFAIEDLGSRSGTRVGEPIKPGEPWPIHPGDTIGIGPFTLTAVRAASQPPSSLVVEEPDATALPPVLLPVARSSAHVLVRGEPGSGKRVLAEALHHLSGRAGGFAAIDCAAVAPECLEGALFGGAEGPGALEVVGEGTVLLEEVGALPAAQQLALLRAIERREAMRPDGVGAFAVKARLVCATHRDLRTLVESGVFRLDLYYRIAGVTLTIRQPGVELTPEEEAERREIYDALDRCGGNQTRAAKQLGMSRAALAAKLAGYRRPPTSPT